VKQGDIITVLTLTGEIVGKLKSETDTKIILEDPRLIVQSPESKEFGYAKGITISGVENPKEVEIRNWILVVEPDKRFYEAYQKAAVGLV